LIHRNMTRSKFHLTYAALVSECTPLLYNKPESGAALNFIPGHHPAANP